MGRLFRRFAPRKPPVEVVVRAEGIPLGTDTIRLTMAQLAPYLVRKSDGRQVIQLAGVEIEIRDGVVQVPSGADVEAVARAVARIVGDGKAEGHHGA